MIPSLSIHKADTYIHIYIYIYYVYIYIYRINRSSGSLCGVGQAGGEAEEMMTAAALLWLESSMAAKGLNMVKATKATVGTCACDRTCPLEWLA